MAVQTLGSTSVEALRALADPIRLEVCRRLAVEELCVCHLVEDLALGQPLVSHHLKVLREAGLVETRRHSYWTYYRLVPQALNAIVDELAVLRGQSFTPATPRSCRLDQQEGEAMRSWVEGHVLDEQIRGVIGRLSSEFEGTFSPETVERLVGESAGHLADVKVKGYVSLLTEKFARQRLRACAQAEGAMVKEVPEVLFVCVRNAGRSQMAAGLLHRAARGRINVRSAGSTPADDIHANVREAMAEIGIDLNQEFPKPLTDDVVKAADVVVTMGCGDACPVYPGKRYLDWDLPDPAGKPLDEVRAIREDLEQRVFALLSEILVNDLSRQPV
jgi:protein-tyrosine-phosphatase/DNA-binding transcriptional ArsR family regulator